jgi:hypothetical protein
VAKGAWGVGAPGGVVDIPIGSDWPGIDMLCWETCGGSSGKDTVVRESWRRGLSGWCSRHLSGEENSVYVKMSKPSAHRW